MDKINAPWQQGDVQGIPVERLPEGCVLVKQGAGIIIAEGEVTGHAHRVRGVAELYRAPNGDMFLVPIEETDLDHETHNRLRIPAGPQRIAPVVEVDHLTESIRRVAD